MTQQIIPIGHQTRGDLPLEQGQLVLCHLPRGRRYGKIRDIHEYHCEVDLVDSEYPIFVYKRYMVPVSFSGSVLSALIRGRTKMVNA